MNARPVAARVLAEVLTSGLHLDRALDMYMDKGITDKREQGLVRELCYGVMRWYYRYDYLLGLWLGRPLKPRDNDIRALILCGLYQLEFLRVPDHAAVAATVEAANSLHKPWARGFINAVLRRFQRETGNLDTLLAASPQAHYAHPDWLLQRLQEQWPQHWQQIIASNNQRPPLHLRVNLSRTDRDTYLQELHKIGIGAEPSELGTAGVRLLSPLDVDAIPGFSDGLVSVQDFGAQLAAPLLDIRPHMRVLDACAAPGGKTGHIYEIAPPGVDLVAVESAAERTQLLLKSKDRLGFDAKVIHSDIIQRDKWWDGNLFDRILLDAPCSATGVIRRHPDIKVLRTPEQVVKLTGLQHQMLDAVWPVLKPGGKLLYVTCSLLIDEGDRQIEEFIRDMPDAGIHPIQADWGLPGSCGRWLIPGAGDTDGFYYAALSKSG